MTDQRPGEDTEPLAAPAPLISEDPYSSPSVLARRRRPRTPQERRRVWSRRIEGLFWALRAGALLTVLVAAGLYLAWRTDLTMRWVLLYFGLAPLVTALVLWGIGILAWQERAEYWVDWQHRVKACRRIIKRLLPVAGVATCGLLSAGGALGLWHDIFMPLDASAGELLAFAMTALGLGSFFTFDLLQRVTRSFFPEVAQASSLRSRLRTRSARLFLPTHLRSTGSWSSRIVLVVILLAPTLVLSASAYLAHNWDRPRPIPVAAPATLPTYPASFPSQVTWTHDIPSALDVNAGAAGPLVLTDDSLISLDPSTGKIRWDYHRQGKKFAQYGGHVNSVLGERPYLITSPDRRHVALTLGELEFQGKSSDGDYGLESALTIVLDTVTGRVTNEHLHDGKAVQLTDSVLLAGSTVYSLADDSILWRLNDVDLDLSEEGSPYTGTAGHASLILAEKIPGSPNGIGLFTLVPDTNPRGVVRDVPAAYANREPLIVEGWTVTYPEATQDEFVDVDGNYSKAHRAQAVSLDALAKVPGADTHAYDLGQTLGIAPMASFLSGRLAVLPATAPTPVEPNATPGPDGWKDQSTVATTFNPRTRAVLAAPQDPGLVTAVGITRADDGQGRISLQSGDKSKATSIPLENGTVPFVPGARGRNGGVHDFPVNMLGGNDGISALSAPGVTIVVLRPTYESQTTGTRIRLYGLVGASS
ncbi:hypothetical protein BKH23_10885 [Actinomyces oris]|uniref:hypothetical protein n=1 Tax=Actinomyces TaxID=1654 RepID=UPI00094D5206|nr:MULTISPECIES: hypothetical protein [Actinomyces]OLO59617.1 hypothetical protein BKH23_10885 [Actinomyces oris]